MAVIGGISISRLCLVSVNIAQKKLLQKSTCRLYAIKLFSETPNPGDRHYSDKHSWIKVLGYTGVIGISKYAQEKLGDVIHVRQPEEGEYLTKGDKVASIDYVGASFYIHTPVTGVVSKINTELGDNPELVKYDPLRKGWIYKMKLLHKDEIRDLMDESSYQNYITGLNN